MSRNPGDWTFVLEQPCDECGVEVSTIAVPEIADVLRESIDQWEQILTADEVDHVRLMTRPSPDVWSPVEYALHVAEVMDVFQERNYRMLTEDDPLFVNWEPNQAAEAYAGKSPADAVAALHGASERFAAVYEALHPDLWDRSGRRSDGYRYTVANLGRYFLHDDLHHLNDVRKQLGLV
jgi:DinB superfamily